jgi:hypothetical protein
MSELGRFGCGEVLRRLDDYVDRALSAYEILLVEEHLACCVACAEAEGFLSTLTEGIRSRLRRIAVPPGLRQAIHDCLATETATRARDRS